MQLLIIDDNTVIMGSANINDRSMLGTRDSELGICIQGSSDSEDDAAKKRIVSFRKQIFKEHYGIDIEDPSSEKDWKSMLNIAKMNTDFYNRVFKVYPSNEYQTFKSVKNRNKTFDQEGFQSGKDFIKGHAVVYPYNFLVDENLTAAMNYDLFKFFLPAELNH